MSRTMQSLILQEDANEKLKIIERPIPVLKAGEALIKMKTASLNHRDQWCRVGMYPGLRYPAILGSDGCGVVAEVADAQHELWIGKEVIMNPNVNWGTDPDFQSLNYSILGMPSDGTFSEYLAVPVHRLHEKPAYLTAEQAAAVPLAALTAYRAVFAKGKVKKDSTILITGIGGGVAIFAFQFAKAVGAKTYITSGSNEKLEKVMAMGADFGVNYKEENWDKSLLKKEYLGFHTIIDGAGGESFGKLAKMIGPAGTMVVYGTTAGGATPIHLPRLFFAQATITGTTMGNDSEFKETLDFMAQHQIIPLVSSVRPFKDIISAFDEMHEGKQFGKLVISIS